MKKLISVILTILVLVSLMASCKSQSEMKQVSSDIASESVSSYDNQVYSSEPIMDGSDSFQNSDETNNNQNNITNNSNQTKSNSNSKNTLKNIPKYIGYKTASGKSEILKQNMSTKHAANIMPLIISKATGNSYCIETLSDKHVEKSYIGGQNPVLTLLVENTERDSIVDVLVDDTENGINNVYSTSATKYKINRVDTEYNQERKTYVTEIELSIPVPKKEGSRTITIKEIGFLRAYVKGTAEMPQNVPKIVNYKVLNNKLGAEGYTIIETKEELIDVHNNLNGKYALGNNIDLGGMEWTPIGTNAKPFTGQFYGDGYTISNYKITKSPASLEDGIGFFGNVSGEIGTMSGTISNLVVSGAINIAKAKYVGGVIGIYKGICDISCCGNRGNITVGEATDVGGVVGTSNGGVAHLFNTGNISVKKGNVSGIICSIKAGIIPEQNSFVSQSYNTGKISTSNGTASGISNTPLHICYVYNTGKIYGTRAFGICDTLQEKPAYVGDILSFVFWYDAPDDDATAFASDTKNWDTSQVYAYKNISDMYCFPANADASLKGTFIEVPNRIPKLKWER